MRCKMDFLENTNNNTDVGFFSASQTEMALGIAFIFVALLIIAIAYACKKVYNKKKIVKEAMDKLYNKKDNIVTIFNNEIDFINNIVGEETLDHIVEEDDIFSPKVMKETQSSISNFIAENKLSSPDFKSNEESFNTAFKDYINHCLNFNKAYISLMGETKGFFDSIASMIVDKNDPITYGVYSYTGKLELDDCDI